jgi:Zn-dependent peptidase ImmA (M78 family)/DNA-binding XRE family transcriptional regulator
MTNEQFVGSRLRLIRQFHGMTLAELGEVVGNSRQYINQIETGKKKPTNELAEVLSEELGVHLSFFLQPVNDVDPDRCNFRKLKTTAVRASEQVIAHSTLFTEFIGFLEDHLDFQPVNFPRFESSKDYSVEDIANECRRYWKLSSDQPIKNMTRVLESAGAIVTTFRSVSEKIDALSVTGERPIVIRSVSKKSPTRLRFDLAHECGHIVMHDGNYNLTLEKREEEANAFAAAFLLPKESFVDEFPRRSRLDWRAMFALKRDWGVSVQAILRRAFDLDLITKAQYRSGNIYISKQGYRRNEPFEPATGEEATLIRTGVRALQDHFGKSLDDVANDMRMTAKSLARLVGIQISVTDNESPNVVDISGELGWTSASWAD